MNDCDAENFDRLLVEHIESIRFHKLSDVVIDRVKLLFLDHLATLMFSTKSAQYPRARAMLPLFGQGDASLVGGGASSLFGAAYYHGLLATSDDFDDSHRYVAGLHLGASIFPALVALSAQDRLSGRHFIEAVCCGYETASKIGRVTDTGLRQRMWHATGVLGPLGAATAAARALGMTGEATRNAIGIAASSSGGLFAFLANNATVRHAHGANAAAGGLSAVIAATAGMTGPANIFSRSGGFFTSFVEQPDFSVLTSLSQPVRRLEVLDAYVKLFPCCGHAYPSITAAMEYWGMGGRADDISSIRLEVYRASSLLNNTAPQNIEALKFSLPALIGITLSTGELGYSQVTMDALKAHVNSALLAKIEVVEDPEISVLFPMKRAARIIIETKSGERIEIFSDSPLGMPENPANWDQVEKKFLEAADESGATAHATRILDSVAALETVDSIDAIARLLAEPAHTM